MRAKKYLTSKDKTGSVDKALKTFKRFKAVDGGYTSRDQFPGTNQKGTGAYGKLEDTAASIYGSVMPQPVKLNDDGSMRLDGVEAAEATLFPAMVSTRGIKAAKGYKAYQKAAAKKGSGITSQSNSGAHRTSQEHVQTKSRKMAKKIRDSADESIKKAGPVNPKNKSKVEQDIRMSKGESPVPKKSAAPKPVASKVPTKKKQKSFLDFKRKAR